MLSLNYENINYVMTQILKPSCASFSYVNISYVLADPSSVQSNMIRTLDFCKEQSGRNQIYQSYCPNIYTLPVCLCRIKITQINTVKLLRNQNFGSIPTSMKV